MVQKVRFGIFGTNFISDRFAEAVNMSGVAEVTAVCSRTTEAACRFAQAHQIPLTFTEREAFFRCAEVDAVYIAVPNALHAPFTVEALSHGKHVLCEKPIALSVAEMQHMQACAKENGKLLMEAMRPYFDPAMQTVRALLPRLGRLRYGRLEFSQYSSRYDKFKAGEILRAFDPAYGNAALMDIGIYPISVAAMLFGKPQAAAGTSLFLPNGFEGLGTATLTYKDMLVDVVYSKITQGCVPSALVGENGTLTVDSMNAPAEIVLITRDGKTEKMPCTPHQNNMVYEVKAFCEAVAAGLTQHPSMTWTAIGMEVVQSLLLQNGITFNS